MIFQKANQRYQLCHWSVVSEIVRMSVNLILNTDQNFQFIRRVFSAFLQEKSIYFIMEATPGVKQYIHRAVVVAAQKITILIYDLLMAPQP